MKPQFQGSEDDDNPLYTTDNFRMYCFKVLPCSKRFCHDWTTCPFAHPQEKAKRRPRLTTYTGVACPDMKKNAFCPRGESCSFAHNVFEYWCHPSRYRTQLCNDGANCSRKGCFFAHTLDELRQASVKVVLPGDSAAAASAAAATAAAAAAAAAAVAPPPRELLDSCSSDPNLTAYGGGSGREECKSWRSASYRNMSSQPCSPTWSPTATVTGDVWDQASEQPSVVSMNSSRGSSRGSAAMRNEWRLLSKDPKPSRYSGGDLVGGEMQLQLATGKNLQQASVLQNVAHCGAQQQQQQQQPAWQQHWQPQPQQQQPIWQQQQQQEPQQQQPAWQQQQQQQAPSVEQLVHAITRLQMANGVNSSAYVVPEELALFNLQQQQPQGCLPSLIMLQQMQQQQQQLAMAGSNFCIPEEATATMAGGGMMMLSPVPMGSIGSAAAHTFG